MSEYLDSNRSLWNGWTPIHAASTFYDVGAFRDGASSLKEIEMAEVGDVRGKRLLHLQCHFGLDTLSWARHGADVTGVDFSDEAVAMARQLADETAIPGRFLCANVYDVPELLHERFGVVFTSYGVLPWLPDLKRWAQVVASMLEPDGVFHVIEFHPLAAMLGDDGRTFQHGYFHAPEPECDVEEGSYANRLADFRHVTYEWSHDLAEVVNALIGAGLRLESLHEYPFSPYNCFPFLEEREPGRWYARTGGPVLPMVFSIRARRPAG